MTKPEKDYYNKIGKVVTSFQRVEAMIRLFIVRLFKEDMIKVNILTSQLPFNRLLKCSLALYLNNNAPTDSHEELKQILKLAGQAEQTRNTYMHSLWHIWQDGNDDLKIKALREKDKIRSSSNIFVQDSEFVTFEEIDDLIEKFEEVVSRLSDFMNKAEFRNELCQ